MKVTKIFEHFFFFFFFFFCKSGILIEMPSDFFSIPQNILAQLHIRKFLHTNHLSEAVWGQFMSIEWERETEKCLNGTHEKVSYSSQGVISRHFFLSLWWTKTMTDVTKLHCSVELFIDLQEKSEYIDGSGDLIATEKNQNFQKLKVFFLPW